jgi:UDP-N-acetylglucosamine--N-acetylmuramyl-(pentapeptide) pyrophosphoryl-undecaprenol N-acetylglucosamine transferase
MVKVAFTGGGTGGHIYPGLAVASCLLSHTGAARRGVFWIGSNKGMDRSIVEEAGIEFFGIPSGRLRRYFTLKTIPDMFRVIAGFFSARRILKKEKPCLLFSKGGFVSVPPCAAAASLKIPVFTHESDYSPGLATRINTRFAVRGRGRIFTAYGDTVSFFQGAARDKTLVCGNPVRSSFRFASAQKGRDFLKVNHEDRILLVLGGSQGARDLNALVRECLAELTKLYVVVHQTGFENDGAPARERYRPYRYIKDEMAQVLAACELVLGRSGAGTIWESAAAGKPMVLVPLAGSGTRGDQVENARFFEKAGAAEVLLGDKVNPRELNRVIKAIACDEEKRRIMAAASAKIGSLDGAVIIAREIQKLIEEREACAWAV